jgi:hypothetical protein
LSHRFSTSFALSIAAAAAVAVVAGGSWSLAAQGDCGQPLSSGTKPNTSDCSYILKAAVGSKPCDLCVCDVNHQSGISTVDALICLKRAVGQNVVLSFNTTTSTSTTSSTTTIPVRCSGNSDCSDLPSGFRCNPNTDTCEKPCTKDTDCHDFYECNKTTGYCQEPPLLF